MGVKTETIGFWEAARQNGLERRLLATVRWTVATAVAFPQESESLAHHFLKKENGYGGLAQLGERLPCKQEVSGSIPLISTKETDWSSIWEDEASLSFFRVTQEPIKSPAKRVLIGEEKQSHSRAFDAGVKCASCGFDFDEMHLENWTLWIMMQLWEGNSKG